MSWPQWQPLLPGHEAGLAVHVYQPQVCSRCNPTPASLRFMLTSSQPASVLCQAVADGSAVMHGALEAR